MMIRGSQPALWKPFTALMSSPLNGVPATERQAGQNDGRPAVLILGAPGHEIGIMGKSLDRSVGRVYNHRHHSGRRDCFRKRKRWSRAIH